MNTVRLKRIAPGHYEAHGFTVRLEHVPDGGRVWALEFPGGGVDGCESLAHARSFIAWYVTEEPWRPAHMRGH